MATKKRTGVEKYGADAAAAGTANAEYMDAALRHHIGVRRYSAGLNKKVANMLEQADRDLTTMLRDRLARLESQGKAIDFTAERWKVLIADIRAARHQALQAVKEQARKELGDFAKIEGEKESKILDASVPIEFSFASVAADQLRAIVSAKPFQGKLLKDWFDRLEKTDQHRLVTTIQLGMTEGQPIEDIVRTVVGTRAQAYSDGVLAITRRDATAIVRTAVNHVSNTARNYVWEENKDVITAKVWVSVLDGRTSAICQARDGQMSPVGDSPLPDGATELSPPGARPPAHFNCRSVMVAYIDGAALVGQRPYVRDTRTRAKREVNFRQIARETGKPIQQVRSEWADKNIGRLPAKTNYQEFLKRQPAAFQDEVLGSTRGKLFRQGKLEVSQFVDRSGNELTLEQLAKTQPEAFIRAGLDPSAF